MSARLALVAIIVVSILTPTSAQSRRNGRLPPTPFGPNARPDVNPVHERQKSEAEQAYRKGEYTKSIELTSSVLRSNPRDDVAYYLRGSSKVELGIQKRDTKPIREGIADARAAINYGGTDKSMYYLPYLYGMTNLSILEARKDHAKVAVKIATQVLGSPKAKPDDKANIYYQRGLANTFLGEHASAAGDHESATRLNVSHLGAFVGAADAHSAAGNTAKATTAYSLAVKAFPTNPLVYNNRGMFYQKVGKSDEAIADFTRCLELDPKYFTAFTNRGFALLEQGNPASAANDLTSSLQIRPNQPMVYSLRGTAMMVQGKYTEAIADYNYVAQLDPKNPIAHADLGFAKFFSGDYRGAQASMDRALTMNPAHRYLVPWIYMAMDKTEQTAAARTRFAESLKRPADKRDWVDNLLGYVAESVDRDALMAAISQTDAKLKNAQTCEAHFFIAQRLAKENKMAEATDAYKLALSTQAKHLSAYRGAQLALGQLVRN